MAEGRKAGQLRKDKAMTAQLTRKGTQVVAMEPATSASRGRLRETCHQIHLTIQELNYAARRVVELQAPWTVDQQWQSR